MIGASATRDVMTPEGVPIHLTVASVADRLVALAVDLGLIILTLIALAIAGLILSVSMSGPAGGALFITAAFLVRVFYFSWFELRRDGRTPGKRAAKLRVCDADGGPLTAEAILVRGFMRELEVFIPLSLVLAPEQLWPGASAMVRFAASGWVLVFAALPLFNRERRRAGDLAGGTIVVVAPAQVLLPDLAAAAARPGAARFRFTEQQLSHYGVYELQVLEEVLRGKGQHRAEQLGVVSRQIMEKIGWPEESRNAPPAQFLRDFYAAQREALERRMLYGRRKEHKDDAAPRARR